MRKPAFVVFLIIGMACSCTPASAEGLLTLLVERDYKRCMASVVSSPEGQALEDKFPLIVKDISFRDMTVQGRPTPQEVQALLILHNQIDDCQKSAIKGISIANPSQRNTLVQGYAALDRIWAALINGQLTWGQANAARKRLVEELANPTDSNTSANVTLPTPPKGITTGQGAQAYIHQRSIETGGH